MELSEAGGWADAALEWQSNGISISDEFTHCICGHRIKELHHMRNVVNGNEVIVGNVCIGKFKVRDLRSAFRALREKKANPALLAYAHEEGIINTREWKFGTKICRRRKPPSAAQQSWFDDIKRKIFKACRAQ